MKKIRSLPHLSVFEAAARHQSFKAAADELFITTGAVSRHIKNLEEQMGILLFYRSHKLVTLTPAGIKFSRVATRLLNTLYDAEKELCPNVSLGRLTVQCLPTFAMHWLMPRLSELNEIYPDITVDVTTSLGHINFDSFFDVAIRRDPAHFSGLKPVPFLKENSLLVCSKEYLKCRPLISPDKLEGHVKLQIRAREDLWESWYSNFPDNDIDNAQVITLDHTFAAIQAAEDGLGIVVIPYLFCSKHLESGRLISPFGQKKISTGEYYLLFKDANDDITNKFIDWLKSFAEDLIT